MEQPGKGHEENLWDDGNITRIDGDVSFLTVHKCMHLSKYIKFHSQVLCISEYGNFNTHTNNDKNIELNLGIILFTVVWVSNSETILHVSGLEKMG